MAQKASMKAAALLFSAAAVADPAPERRLGFDFGTVTADSSNPASLGGAGADPSLSSLLGNSMMGMGGMPQTAGNMPMLTPQQEEEVNKNSAVFVQHAVMSFLNKESLPPQEMQCIKDSSGVLGGNLGDVMSQFGMVLQKAFDVDIPLVPDAAKASAGAAGAASSGAFDMSSFGPKDEASSVGSVADQILQKQSGGSQASLHAPAPLPLPPSGSPATLHAPAPAPAPAKSPSAASMDFFYNAGRRLQALPGMSLPDSSSSSGGGLGMPGISDIPMAMELGVSIKKITDETGELVDKCLQPDAKLAFKQAASRMTSVKMITGHFLANGADVINEMSDMVIAYDKKDPARFGTKFGRAMRKVFLSNSTKGTLPEGLPDAAQMSNVSAGLLRGFFGPGTTMKVHLAEDPTRPINIDMHNCVRRNTPYFQQIYGTLMYFMGKEEAGVGATAAAGAAGGATAGAAAVNAAPDATTRQMQFASSMAFTMLELPQAMGKCGLSGSQQDMIMDSVKSLGSGMDAKVGLPPAGSVHNKAMKEQLAETVGTWASNNWYDFGKKMGGLMQESAVKFYPQKYSVDAGGILRNNLLPEVQKNSKLLTLVPAALVIAGAAIAVKLRRSFIGAGRRGRTSEEDQSMNELLSIEEALE